MKSTLWTALILGLMATNATAQQNQQNQNQRNQPNQQNAQNRQSGAKEAFLGVSVEAVSAALRSQLPNLAEGQGIMVEHVAKDSPAAKAGLKAHDIILSFGGQNVGSPEQLVKMVRNDSPGQQVAIGYLRGGKSATSQVTLGERQHQEVGGQPNVYRFFPAEDFMEEFATLNGESGWTSFEAMNLKRTGEHQWAAEIEYRNKDGKKEMKKFTGTREEIHKAIQGDKDLPADEQRHLLRALDMQRTVFEFHFPNGGPAPGSGSGDQNKDP